MGALYPGLVLAIFGPTASGKTDVAEALTARIPAEIVSADAMQVYRGLPILTNQSSRPAHLVGIWPLSHEGSVAEYQPLAHETIDGVLARARTPVVVGGTGLYLRAALSDMSLPPPPAAGARERWEAVYDRDGPAGAHAELARRDAAAAAAVHPNDRRRVVRALELSEAGWSLRPRESALWADSTRHPTLVVGLVVPTETLGRRIAARTERMWERGAEEEVQRALGERISHTALTIHGLREIAEQPRERAVDAYNARVRRYAAYQRKWMRRVPGIELVDADRPPDRVAADILERASARAGRD